MLENTLLKSFSDDIFSAAKVDQTILESSSDLVIIDSSVDDLSTLVNGVKAGAKVVVLDPDIDGIEQITSVFRQHNRLKRVHLVTHGSSGSLQLGSSRLDSDTLNANRDRFAIWSEYLADTSLLIYGCEVAAGEQGRNFVRRLHEVTGTNIAAATHKVGNPKQGGSWSLNYQLGANIKPELAFTSEVINSYSGTFI
ncbi:MAG: DUF4347 domain-containing protein, partial [Cyanobacteria bacterium J06600_6]